MYIHTCIYMYIDMYMYMYMYLYVYECMYISVYNTHICDDKSCTVCLRQSGTSWITCMLGCSPCTLHTCPGWLSSCRLFFCTVLCITRQLLTNDAQTFTKPQIPHVLSGLYKAEKLACKAIVDAGCRHDPILMATQPQGTTTVPEREPQEVSLLSHRGECKRR